MKWKEIELSGIGEIEYKCPYCGNHKDIKRPFKFCPYCGKKIDSENK